VTDEQLRERNAKQRHQGNDRDDVKHEEESVVQVALRQQRSSLRRPDVLADERSRDEDDDSWGYELGPTG